MRRLPSSPKVEQILKQVPFVNDWLGVVTDRLNIYESAANPVLSEIPEKQWILHHNTTTNTFAIWTRIGAVLYSISVSASPATSVVSETAFGQASAVGVATNYAREDHTHGTPALPKLDDLAAPDDNTDLNASTSAHGLLRKLDGTTTNFLRGDGAWAAPSAGSGDVTGPASSVNNNVVLFNGTTGKIIKDSGLTLAGTNTGDQTITLTGDVTGSGTGSFAATIPNNTVTYAKMQDISATSRVLGRKTAGAGDTEELTASELLAFLGNTQGQILYRDGSGWTVLSAGSVGQALMTGGAGANPSWGNVKRQLANVTLTPAGTTLSSGTITACKFLEIHIFIAGYSGSDTASLQFNGAGGTAYRYRWLSNGAAATTFAAGNTAISTDRIKIASSDTTRTRRVTVFISNDSTVTEKLCTFSSTWGTTSAGTQQGNEIGNGAWVSGAATQITQVDLISTSNMTAGTQMVIYGWN